MQNFNGILPIDMNALVAFNVSPDILKHYVRLTRAGEHDMMLTADDIC